MIFIEKNKCPLCGKLGKPIKKQNIKECPSCDILFNDYGIISSIEEDNIIENN